MPEKLYAFWKYDSPPYLLGGEVIKIREEDGGVFVKGYDKHMSSYFAKEAIVTIVPYKEGIKLHKKLKKAEKRYNQRMQKAKRDLRSVTNVIAQKTLDEAVIAAAAHN